MLNMTIDPNGGRSVEDQLVIAPPYEFVVGYIGDDIQFSLANARIAFHQVAEFGDFFVRFVDCDSGQVGQRINLLQQILRVLAEPALRQPISRKQIARKTALG